MKTRQPDTAGGRRREAGANEIEGDVMKKVKPVVARNAKELAKALGLTPADGVEIEIRSDLNDKIIEVVSKRGLTHSQVARVAHTSRTRVTAILNRNTAEGRKQKAVSSGQQRLTDTRHPTPDTRYPIPDTRHPTPDTRYPRSKTKNLSS
jgi:predicted XRE-type DNA-binding protein